MVFWEWIEAISAAAFLVIYYFYVGPVIDLIVWILTNLGTPAAPEFFIVKILQWVFIIFMIGIILRPILASYRDTYDQGQTGRGF